MKNLEFKSIEKVISFLNQRRMIMEVVQNKPTVNEFGLTIVKSQFNILDCENNVVGRLFGETRIDGKHKKILQLKMLFNDVE